MNIICGLGLLPWLYHFYNIFLKNHNTFHKFIPLFIYIKSYNYEYAANKKYIELSKKVDVYVVLEFVYKLLEEILRIEYEKIDDLFSSIDSSAERVRKIDDFTDEARN